MRRGGPRVGREAEAFDIVWLGAAQLLGHLLGAPSSGRCDWLIRTSFVGNSTYAKAGKHA